MRFLPHKDVSQFCTLFYFSSPNPSNALVQTWPIYQEPEWKFLNLTVGYEGLTGEEILSNRCHVFNKIVSESNVDYCDVDQNFEGLPSQLICKN